GTKSISFTIDANATGSWREGYLTGPGYAYVTIDQDTAPACSYSLSATSASVVAAASSGSFTVNTTAGCAWTASTASSFVTGVTASGTGTGSVSYNVGANTGPARSATITAGAQTYTINQANGCTYTLSATSASATATGGAGSLTVTPSNAACTWTASSNSAFITGVTGSGTGTGSVAYSVGANTSVARSGTLTVAGQTFTVNQASGCTFGVTPSSVTPSSAAGAGSLSITASNAACPWTAANNDAWLAVAPTSGTGSASVTYNVAANSGPSRSGSLTVAGQSVAFTQANGCTASLSASSATISGSGGPGSVTLTMSSSACAWTASSNSPWVTLPASGTGTSLVSFTVAAQAGPARTATLTIGGQTFTVSQMDACTYAINPTSTSVDAAAGIASVQVTASDAACTWSVGSNAAWLASTTATGSGSQTIVIDYSANVSILRSGTMTIAGNTFTVTQADGCTVNLSSSSTSVVAAGSSGSVALTMSAQACAWSASTSSDFISGVTGSGVGNGSVAFSVAANAGPARVGTIAVGSKTFTIDQASGCTASLASTSANTTAAGSTGTVALTMSASTCPWTAASNASWIGSVTASGTGSASISYTAAANTGLARSGTLTIAGQTFTLGQADGCSFSLSPTQATAAVAGGLGSVAVTASDPACPFTTSSSTSWITDVTPGATGSATINYTVAANAGIARSSTITIAGHSFAIDQSTGCVATLTGQSASIGSSGGSLTIGVTLSSPSCTWTAAASHPFISNVVFAGAGSGSVTFDVAANTGVERTGTLTIAGKTVTITQGDGCSFLINPTGAEVASSSTGPFNFALTASDSSCPWTMLANNPWVTVNTPSGTGSSTLSYSATANVGPARSSNIEVGGRTFTVLQDNGCSATISPNGTIELSAAAQASQFDISLSAQTCTWTASSSNSWLTVTDTEGTGNGTAHFSVEANVGPERTLQIQLQGDQTVTVHQASGCGVTLPAGSASAQPAGGSSSFNVTAASGCGYTADADVQWLSNVTVTAQGVSYDVAASDGVARVGKITVKSTSTEASSVYTITQSSGCVLVLPSAGSTPAASGGVADFAVQTVSGCQFTATTTDTWLEPVTIADGRVSY
ncbi:MAG TPA: BACON domain-containing carbohydrate-binding protein, partial [Polyangiaceae bacterium]